eukprot:m.16364 g.16364  ORF g.16364 m.16364 type:complete len:68 (-) comp28233_c0_seq1:37-240(-)
MATEQLVRAVRERMVQGGWRCSSKLEAQVDSFLRSRLSSALVSFRPSSYLEDTTTLDPTPPYDRLCT